ncbi:PBECR3 domain-containing polyvalent protein [Christensenella hongkongensis]|uniref:Phage-Barnase-EndoU-ColicinE5/D-RelE like nuclease 3 domain-containing protein n=1 Tax=Christensenella hongkongensis TaxID=270498 RepID=A0A0M2NP18_9FIRM|nr:hypothetical protein [Christensenella hongkongensis]KKI51955.1 hypothetical protein CHK_0532 [Christensenella hongkongensis]TCW24019.1 hypothetical protein EV208_12521 [Christensenella hongkongensis]
MPNVRNSTNKLNTRSVSSAQQEANRRRQEELRRRREAERRRAEARRKQEEARRRQEEARKRLAENSRQREQAANRNRKTDSSMRGGVSGKTASKANRVSAPSYTERLSKEEKMRRAGMQLYQWTQQAKEQKFGKSGLPKSFMPEQNAAAKSQNGMFDLLIPKKQEPGKAEIKKNGNLSTNRTSNKELSDTDYQSILKRSDLDLLAKQGKEQEISDTKNGTRGMWRSLTNELDLERQEREKGNDDPSLQVSSQMTDDELKTYYAVYALHGMEEADKYKERINQSIQERVAGNRLDKYNDLDNEAIKAIAGTIIDYGSGVESGVQGIQQTASLLGGNEKPHDSTSGQITREKLREGYTGARAVVSDLTNNVGNMTPALMASLFPGGQALSAATLGVSSFGNSYRQAKQEGKPTDQAVAYAIPSALSEVLMQKVLGGVKALGGNTNLAKSAANAMGKAVKNPIAQKGLESLAHMGSEGAEEYLQALLDPILRNAAFGEQNKLDPLSEDKLYAAFLGALSAEAMNLPADVANVAQTKNVGKTLNNSEGLQGLIESGLESSPDSASFGQAQRLQNREAMGKKASDFEVGSLANANQAAIDAEAKAKAIMENAGIRRAFNPNDTVTLANGNEGIVIAREGSQYVVAETGKQGYSSVNVDDITGKVHSSAQSLNKYIAPEVRARLNEKYDARHVERTANQVFLDKLTQGRGIKAVVEDMQPGAEAFYDRTTNTIHFAPDSTRAEVIGGVTAHELAHAAEGSPNYAKYSDYVMEKLFAGDSAALAQAVEAKQEQYISRGIDLSDADAAAEIVADYTRQLYKSETDIDALVTGNRSMAQSIYDSIKTAIRKIRAFFKGDSATLANIREYQELQRAQKLFERALSTRENVQAEAAPAYALNEFGLEEYTNNEIQQRANSKSILFANREQDIVDFVNDYIVNRSEEYKRLYIGKVGEALADRIFEDTGIDVGNYNVILRSDFENRHANVDAEQSRGQIAITPELIGRLPEIISAYDSVAVSRNAKNGKPALVFEKDVDGKKVAVEYISDKRKEMALQTMYGWENKKNHPTAESAEASPITSETRSGTGSFDNIIPQSGDDVNRKYSIKGENPLDIANLTKDAADTTPVIPLTEEKQADGRKSKFAGSVENSPYLEGDIKELINSDSDVKYYEGIANEDTLDTAYRKLKEGNREEVVRWLTNESKKVTAEDVAEGFILLKQYQDAGDYGSMISVARKLRKMGTQAGQTVQAFSILSRMTPEGMVKFAQAELDDAFEVLKERKSKNWLENNSSRFTLTDDEVQMITDNVLKASNLPEGRDKNILLAEISALIQNKLPSSTASKFRALQRISLLLNPKTNVRNILGNALMMPERIIADFVAAPIDRAISKKTGVRTTGVPNILDYGRGFKKGAYESYNDFRRGINTLNREGNRFEIGEAPAFNPEYAKTKAGKALTKAAAATDRLTSFVLEMGDRPFYEAYFVNSLNNQMKLANVTEPSADMIEIATQDALENTYQDNNGYTKFVEGVRRGMNFGKDFGFGNIVIPFAKTPANLTKALVEFSPVGLVKSITADAAKFNRAVNNGTATPQMQRKLVNNIGKGVAGTLVILLGAFLASEGIISGAGDDDKDAANFARNVLGIQPYSVVIGGKSYTYDWAAPVGPQFAIAADIVNNIKNGDTGNFGMDALGSGVNAILNALQTGGGVLFEQSFLRGIQDFFKEDNLMQALINSGLSVIGQYIPSISNQIAQLTDPVQRTTYAYNNVLQTGMNKAITRIPGLSQSLEPTVDVYGREVQRYGGDNNVFNVMVNPANVAAQNKLPAADEVWRLYQQTGDKTVFPSVAPYYIKYQDEKYDMSPAERTKYQKTMGQSTANVFGEMIGTRLYKGLSDNEKAALAKLTNEYSGSTAKQVFLKGKGVDYEPDEWIIAAKDSGNTAEYIMLKSLTSGVENDRGADGNTIENSGSLRKKDVIDSAVSDEQKRQKYYEDFGINKSVRDGNVTWGDINSKTKNISQAVIPEAAGYDIPNYKTETLEKINKMGVSIEDYAYVSDRLEGKKDKLAYIEGLGFSDEQVDGLVEGLLMSDSGKKKMLVANEDYGIDNKTYVKAYRYGYSTVGSKGERNDQIWEYVNGLNLGDEQKEALYGYVKVSRGKDADGTQTGGSSGGSGRRRSGSGRSSGSAAAKKAEKAAFELSQVKTLPDLDWSLLTPKKTAKATPNTKIPDILAPLMIGDKIREETLQKELAGIDESPLYTSEMKQKIKAGIRARYKRS